MLTEGTRVQSDRALFPIGKVITMPHLARGGKWVYGWVIVGPE